MDLGAIVPGFSAPPRPNGLRLTGARCWLEPTTAAHAPGLHAAYSVDANWAYMPYGPFETEIAFTRWLKQETAGNDPTFYTIRRAGDGAPLGVASYLRITPEHGVIEVGHIHFSPLLQRTTLATEAMYLMMKWTFEAGYRRYEWKCNALNTPSRRAAQRLGFSYEGTFRQAQIPKGRNRDTAWFAMIDSEWPAFKACFETFLDSAKFDAKGRPRQSLRTLTAPLLHAHDPGL